MASSSFSILFLLSLFVFSASSRTLPSAVRTSTSKTATPPILPYGPIVTNGKNYAYVCDRARFADMGLDITMFAYCDSDLPYAVRVKDLIERMTLHEKVTQLGDYAWGVERIGLPKYNWWSEALHGVSDVGRGSVNDPGHATRFGGLVPGATSFPTPILSTASFNESLWRIIGETISTEARAMHNLGQTGLTFWSPNINVARDPRWGRIIETPGEDPFVVARYGVNFVRGMQDVKGCETSMDLNTRPLKVSSCCKHYTAYDVDNWLGIERYSFDARVTEQDMVETFNLPFEVCVKEGDVSSVMCSYNQVNGFPTCADPKLLSQTIRGEWNLHGYIVSDCDSIQVMHDNQKWLGDTREYSVMRTMRAGLDLDCGDYYTNYTESAVQQGKVRESDIDNALKNNYMVLMRLGFFDGMAEYQSLGKDNICTKENLELAADAARQGIVLLKNKDNTLPLNKHKYQKLALVGPHANASKAMIGNYAGVPCRYITPLEAFFAEAKVEYDLGCDVSCNNRSSEAHAKQIAQRADATIIFAGISLGVEAESRDRLNLNLPPAQVEFINQVTKASKGPVILVLFNAGGLDVTFAKNDPKISAIVWAGFPGAEGGRAIADVLYGRHNPSGRLPITWYENEYTEMLPMISMQLRPIEELGYPGRTYKFYDGPTVYPFGFGLSYTQFNYTVKPRTKTIDVKLGPYQRCLPLDYKPNATVPACPAVNVVDTCCEEDIVFDVEVANTGKVDGTDVLIVYSKAPSFVDGAPIKQVIAFQRVYVRAGSSEVVCFSINACKGFGLVEKNAYRVFPSGQHTVVVEDGRLTASFPVTVSFSK